MADYIDWPGYKGTYRYWFLDAKTASDIKPVAGNYMFVKPTNEGWRPVYIGISDDLQDRLPGHKQWAAAVRLGATRVMAHTNPNAANRAAEEADLIAYWQPALNVQRRGQGTRRAG